MTDISDHLKLATAIPEAGLLGRIITKVADFFAIAIIVSAAVLIYEVFMRYVFNAPTIWAHETVIFLTAITFVYGGLFCASTNKHIRVVLIYDALPPNVRRWFDISIFLVNAGATALFSWAGWLVLERALWNPAGDIRIETSGSAWNPPTPGLLKLFLFIALIMMFLQFLHLAYGYWKNND
jgi:C4-dicarboxylate transporter DctQ subunit